MISFPLLCLTLGSLLALIIFLVLNYFAQFNQRTVDDVPEMIRPQNPEIDARLFDPAVDDELHRLRTTLNFRRKQRIRLDLAAERYRCKRHNARLMLQWANTEWRGVRRLHTMDEYTKEALENLLLARQLGRRFFWLASLLLAKLWFLRIALRLDVFQLLHTPKIGALRKFLNVDVLNLYQEFKQAMAEFARTYGDEEAERIRALV